VGWDQPVRNNEAYRLKGHTVHLLLRFSWFTSIQSLTPGVHSKSRVVLKEYVSKLPRAIWIESSTYDVLNFRHIAFENIAFFFTVFFTKVCKLLIKMSL
jgi:hypothetical protein